MGSCDPTAPAAGRCATSGDRYGDKLNPGSVILSGEMMLRSMGWTEAADAIIKAMDVALGNKKATYDFARLMEGATEVKCSEFADELIKAM